MSEPELFDGAEPVRETEDGYKDAGEKDESALDSEVDFDDEEYTDDEEMMIGEREAGNAEGGNDAHLDDPVKAADDSTW